MEERESEKERKKERERERERLKKLKVKSCENRDSFLWNGPIKSALRA